MSARLGQQLVGQSEFLALGQLGELGREFGRHARRLMITGPVSSGDAEWFYTKDAKGAKMGPRQKAS